MMMQDDSERNEARQANAAGPTDGATLEPAQGEQATQPSDSETQNVSVAVPAEAAATSAEDGPTSQLLRILKASGKRLKRTTQAKQAADLHKVRLTSPDSTEADATIPVAASVSNADDDTATVAVGKKRRVKKDKLQDWDQWGKFRLWRRTRPFAGSVLMLLSALILLAFPISFLQFAFLLNTLWGALLIGGLMLIMALAQLFVPSYALLTGSIGIVLALVSFVGDNAGGLCIGMMLGIIGGALSVAWRPVKRARLIAAAANTSTSSN